MKIFKFTLYLLIFLFLISSKSFSQEPYIITSESLEIIPNKHLSFLEGFDETVSFEVLESVEWSDRLLDAQSMVDGYWVRFVVKNILKTDKIGLSHNFNYEKKIFIKNSLGVDEFSYWRAGIDKHFEETHIGSEFRINIPKNEKTIIYNFFRNYPVDRFNSMDNYHRMMIGSWESVRNKEFFRLIGKTIFIAPVFLFGIYYFFVYLISKGNYIWLSLALLLISFHEVFGVTGLLTNHLGIYSFFPSIASVSGMIFFVPLLFLILSQFFRKTLKIKEKFPKLNKIYLGIIWFYIIVVLINFILLLNWPNEEQINLVKYPPDNLGPGVIKLHQFIIPFFILLLISIIVAFLSWRKGSSASGYLCLSFLLPFLSIPVAATTYLIFDGFNWHFWSIIQPIVGFLFLGMFVTFGFSVAQGMNDLKQEFIDRQIELNNELESKVNARTADLTKANLMITDSINSASAIQNAILPEINADSHGFKEFKYVWEPRDIVGGDFYWIGQKESWTSLIVADCTGHGIPGAFMTLISSTLLDRVANLSDLSQPDRILDQLDELLESTLKYKEGGNTNFGLDCGIICFSQKHNLLRYAGAKTNLYQKLDEEVVEIKGDKKSLGYERKEHPIKFKVSEFGLDQNSSFFIFSDGVTDQVGGEKKLMYGKKRVIAHIKEAVDVRSAVNNIVADINQYQAGHKRRDDLTLFGFAV